MVDGKCNTESIGAFVDRQRSLLMEPAEIWERADSVMACLLWIERLRAAEAVCGALSDPAAPAMTLTVGARGLLKEWQLTREKMTCQCHHPAE